MDVFVLNLRIGEADLNSTVISPLTSERGFPAEERSANSEFFTHMVRRVLSRCLVLVSKMKNFCIIQDSKTVKLLGCSYLSVFQLKTCCQRIDVSVCM